MKYILHIGPGKTGTKSLQRAFYCKRNILQRLGIKYPKPFSGYGHHWLARVLSGEKLERLQLSKNWEEEFRKRIANAEICVISSEAFSNIRDLGAVTTLFPPDNTKVVIYVREPITHASSWYRHKIYADNFTISFIEFAARHHHGRIFDLATQWIQAYGRENVILRHYDRESMPDGSIVIDFANLIRPELVEVFKTERFEINEGISGNLLFIKRVLNCFLSMQECISIRGELKKISRIKPDFTGKIPVDAETARQINILARAQFNALESQYGISVKLHDRRIVAPPVPDRDTLQHDLNLILEKARKEKWNIATLIQRNFGMLALDDTYRAFAKNTMNLDRTSN